MMRAHLRYAAVLLVTGSIAVSLAATTLSPQVDFGQGPDSAPASILFMLANRERQGQRLPGLKWSEALARAARQHAQQMARRGRLSHQFPGEPGLADRAKRAGVRFQALAENVAQGPRAEAIHRQWMESSAHRQNLLDPEMDSLGIAVVEQGGVLFAVQNFSGGGGAAAAVSIPEQEKRVGARLDARGLRLLPTTAEARRTCLLDKGYVETTRPPAFVLHYFTSDLEGLPDMLERVIRSGRFGSAMVGACSAAKTAASEGFPGFRIAVLLY